MMWEFLKGEIKVDESSLQGSVLIAKEFESYVMLYAWFCVE